MLDTKCKGPKGEGSRSSKSYKSVRYNFSPPNVQCPDSRQRPEEDQVCPQFLTADHAMILTPAKKDEKASPGLNGRVFEIEPPPQTHHDNASRHGASRNNKGITTRAGKSYRNGSTFFYVG